MAAPDAGRQDARRAAAGPGAWALALMLGCVAACGSDRLLAELDGAASAKLDRALEHPLGVTWANETHSPRPAHEGRLGLSGCAYDGSLTGLAEAVADRQAARAPAFEGSELLAMLRSRGSPHVWPRLWTLEGDALAHATIREKWQAWLAMSPPVKRLRCGVARARSQTGRDIVAAVVVDALADLDPLPARVRFGQWLRLSAHLLGSASSGRVVLLGPRGTPRKVPSQVNGDTLRSTFSLDQQGLWRIQVLLDTDAGPRPALEAWVFVDETPDLRAGSRPAPGESLGRSITAATVTELRGSLLEMVNAARQSEQRLPLRRRWDLDRLAQAHAEDMWRSNKTAHDAGQGSPVERLAQAGVRAFRVGENVAHARSLEQAHRALWDSPSHRENLLDSAFEVVGLGAVATPSGVWVCELFVDYAAGVTGAAVDHITGHPLGGSRPRAMAEANDGPEENVGTHPDG